MNDPIEHRVATALRELFPEPDGVQLQVPTAACRPRAVWAIAAAVLVILAAATVFAVRRHTTPPVHSLTCPSGAATGVPALPAAGLDGGRRLTPTRAPDRAVLCRYDRGGHEQRSIVDPATLAGFLGWLPGHSGAGFKPCPLSAHHLDAYYLIGLTFGADAEWIWVPRSCGGASNGKFHAYGDIGAQVTEAYRSGRWPAVPLSDEPCVGSYGRLGQERTMVPGDPVRLQLCTIGAGPRTRVITSPADVASYARTLNGLPTEPSRPLICGTDGPSLPSYALEFGYATGPPVDIRLSGCTGTTDNGSLATETPTIFLARVAAALR